MSPKVALPVLFFLLALGLSAQTVDVKASVDAGLSAVYQNGSVTFGSNAENTAIVGNTKINGSVGVLTATFGDSFYGATLSSAVGAGGANISSAWGWYKPLNWMTIAAGTTNPNPFGSLDNYSGASFGSPGVAAMVDLTPLQFGGVVASQAGATGRSPNLTLTGGARVAAEGLATVNFIVGTIETIWLEWFHASTAVTPFPGLVLNAGYSAESITTSFSDEVNSGLSFALIPEVGLSGYVQCFHVFGADRYFLYSGTVGWQIAPGLSLSGTASGDNQPHPSSTGKGSFLYQPYAQVSATFAVTHVTNPGNKAVPSPETSASVDFSFSM